MAPELPAGPDVDSQEQENDSGGRTQHRACASLLPRGNAPKLDSARRFTDLFGLKGAQVEQQVARRLVPVGGGLLKTAEDEGPQPRRDLFRLGIILPPGGQDGPG